MFFDERRSAKKPSVGFRFYRRFTAFASGTQFHGCGQIAESGNWAEQTIWALVLTVCIVLTVKDVSDSLREFVAGGTSSTTTIRHNESIHFPNTSVCMDVEIDRFSFGNRLDARNVTAVQQFLRENVETFLYLDFLTNTTDPQSMSRRHPRNHTNITVIQAAVELSTLLITAMTNVESSLFTAELSYMTNATRISSPKFDDLITSYPDTVIEMYNFYVERGMTDWPRLKRITAQLLCQFMIGTLTKFSVDAAGASDVTPFSVCNAGRAPLWLGRPALGYTQQHHDRLCVLIDPDAFRFDSMTMLLFRVFPSRLYRNISTEDGELPSALATFHMDAASATGVAECTANCVDLQLFDRYGKPAQIARNILLQGEYKAYAGKGDGCADNAVPLDCMERLRYDELNAACKCRSFSFSKKLRQNDSNLPFCAIRAFQKEDSYGKCARKIAQRSVTFSERLKKCQKNCKQSVVAFLHDEFPNEIRNIVSGRQNDTYILFTASGYQHPYVEESLKVELADFLVKLGGNLSLWLGGSFLALLHLFVYLLRVFLCGSKSALDSGEGASFARETSFHWEKTFNDLELADIFPAALRREKLNKEQFDASVRACLRELMKHNVEAAIADAAINTTHYEND